MSEANVSTAGSEHNLVEVSSRKSSFKKRTRLECVLLVVVLILAVLLIIFFLLTIILACMNDKAEKITHKPTCGSEECIASAYSLLESMDQNADPCEDFYQFACGNWAKNHPVKESELSNTWFAERSQALIRELKDLLKENNENSSDPNAVLQVKSLYRACIDIEKLESLGLEPIMQVLDKLSLPRDIPNNETAANWDIATTLALAQKTLSLDSLIQLGPDIDSSNNGKILLNFAPPSEVPQLIRSLVSDPYEMPKVAHLSTTDAIKVRLAYMVKIIYRMTSWGKDESEPLNVTSISATVIKIMMFAAQVATGISKEENDTISTKSFTIPELQKTLDLSTLNAKYEHKINWEKYMDVLLGQMGQSFNIAKDVVSVTDIHYFQKLAILIANSQMETIQRYVWWQVVELLAPHTNKAMRDIRNEMLEKFFGKLPMPSRSTLCLRRVKKLLPMAVSYTKAKQVAFNSTVSKVTEMLSDIKNSFNSLVQEGDWINLETKQAAQEKAEAIASFVGYQDWLLQPGKLDEYYAELELIENQYLLSVIRIKGREVNDFLDQILNQKYGSHKNESNSCWDSAVSFLWKRFRVTKLWFNWEYLGP